VAGILEDMTNALEASGAAKMSPPPPVPSSSTTQSSSSSQNGTNQNFHWARPASRDGTMPQQRSIDHRYDVNSNRGRDLHVFLSSITPSHIEQRRASRMDASAAALVARRLFSFQSIDGISLGWSSESFAVLLSSLIRLHEEHHSRFRVQSFYPLRLVFSSDEFRVQSLDTYGGNLYLHPASTHLQWLESLQEVTDDLLEEFSSNRRVMKERASHLQDKLGIKLQKGLSCSSMEYFLFLDNIVGPHFPSTTMTTKDAASSSQLVPFHSSSHVEGERVRLVVETPAACRRAKVTKEGTIRIPSNIGGTELSAAVSKFLAEARERLQEEKLQQERCRQAIHHIQWELGVQKIFRTGVVQHDDFLGALSRMMDQSSELGRKLAGYSLGIAGRGQFCSIADDGSLIVPHNWK